MPSMCLAVQTLQSLRFLSKKSKIISSWRFPPVGQYACYPKFDS